MRSWVQSSETHTCTHVCTHAQEGKLKIDLVLCAYKPGTQDEKAEDNHNFKANLIYKVRFQVIQG